MLNLKSKIIEFTPLHPLANAWPPEPIKKEVPEWYKQMETKLSISHMHDINNLSQRGTIKKCMPVLDYITSGYLIRNPGDIKLSRGLLENGTKEFINYNSHLDSFHKINAFSVHESNQWPLEIGGVRKTILKLHNFFHIKTPPGYSCLFFQPFYMNENNFTVLPAIVDTDEFTDPVSFPFYINNKEHADFELKIPAGHPFVCVFPFKRDEWKMKINDPVRSMSGEPVGSMPQKELQFSTIMEEAYKKMFHKKKSYN